MSISGEEVVMPQDMQQESEIAPRRGKCKTVTLQKCHQRVFHPITALRLTLGWVGISMGMAMAAPSDAQISIITDYTPITQVVSDQKQHQWVAIRHFVKSGVSSYLLVDPQTLVTSVQPSVDFNISKNQDEALRHSVYAHTLMLTTAPPYPIQNQGLIHAFHPEKKVAYLTIDMCPSSHAFNKEFYERLIAFGAHHDLPMTIDVSGLWILRHADEYAWLKNAIAIGQLKVTWVNHAYRHRYIPKEPLERNFLLIPGTDLDSEILDVEKLLIADNETPSIFIRYPGLVSDKNVVVRTRQLGLIPLGADAWLTKGQPIRNGSIVLVHANGNEPAGLKLLTDAVLGDHIWRPLTEAISHDPQ